MKKIFLTVLTFIILQPLCFAQTTEAFNLSGIIESFMNFSVSNGDNTEGSSAKETFLNAEENLENGNVVVASGEYLKTINSLDNNAALLMLSRRLYDIGYFALGDIAISRITEKGAMEFQIEDLKRAYKPFLSLTKEEENYLAKARASIFYNSSPEEVAFNLIKKTTLMENSDYANFIMAQAMAECRQYNQALIYVDKAIAKNENNSKYKVFRAKTLSDMKKYKEALKYIEKNEDNISVFLKTDLMILKQTVLSNLNSNDNDKKFDTVYSYYIAGNYYKTLNETKNILNFTKNNYKIITLKGMAHLALGEVENANLEFISSYKLNKKFPLTIMGLGDIKFIQKDYKGAYSYYKKLYNTDLKQEAILKSTLCLENMGAQVSKKLAKLEKAKSTFENKIFYEYYLVANNLYSDDLNKRKYAAKSLNINFLNDDTWNILYGTDFRSNNFLNVDKISYLLSFSGKCGAEYYYYSALSENKKNNKKEAFHLAKKALEINPEYKPAIDLINVLQNELI